MTADSSSASSNIRLGLRENWQQFSLLVLINAFVGGMVGLERTVVSGAVVAIAMNEARHARAAKKTR